MNRSYFPCTTPRCSNIEYSIQDFLKHQKEHVEKPYNCRDFWCRELFTDEIDRKDHEFEKHDKQYRRQNEGSLNWK